MMLSQDMCHMYVGSIYPSGTHEIPPVVNGIRVAKSLFAPRVLLTGPFPICQQFDQDPVNHDCKLKL